MPDTKGLTAGGYVHWARVSSAKKGDHFAPEFCIASRQRSPVNNPVEIDLTTQIQPLPHPYLDSMRKNQVPSEDNPLQPSIKIELFDNRFSLVFSRRFFTRVEWTRVLEGHPLSRVILKLGGKWQLPQVVLRHPPKKAVRKWKKKQVTSLSRLHLEDPTEEEKRAGVELLPLQGFVLDTRDENGDWILWKVSEEPAVSGDNEGVKWEFVRVLDVI